jgi:hypothetical protein
VINGTTDSQGNRRTTTAPDCVAVTIIFLSFLEGKRASFFGGVCNQHMSKHTSRKSSALCPVTWPIQSSLSDIPKFIAYHAQLDGKKGGSHHKFSPPKRINFVLHRDKQSGCSADRRQVPLCLGPLSLFLLLRTN